MRCSKPCLRCRRRCGDHEDGLLLASIFASYVNAEEMDSLESVLLGQPEESYQHVRCAALYLENVEWGGQALDEATYNDTRAVILALMLVATRERSKRMDSDLAHLATIVNADVREIANLYAENYRQSYAQRGAAWDGNPIWESDAATCKPIGELALKISAESN